MGGELLGERRRETEKERERWRERRGNETDVPKLYTYNKYEHSVISMMKLDKNECNQFISEN